MEAFATPIAGVLTVLALFAGFLLLIWRLPK
jgi:hypothetical protein